MNFLNDLIRSGIVGVDDYALRMTGTEAIGLALVAAGPILASCAPPPSEFRRPAL